ncbi:trypsin-like serine peptidase [Paraflavitalea devenefica]|uniref:trypsin-like serine peptidase n=1 Tax=Paraflavitalea devenefica TaxID=2716334 RepID=UPI001ABAE263|nr:serine protease [Paraflavitalea devenefica]
MKPKTFTATLHPKNGNGEKNVITTARPTVIESLPPNLTGADAGTETEVEEVEGLVLTRPGEADKEMLNTTETETGIGELLEEAGSEVPEEGVFSRDAFFASYPELFEQSMAEVIIGTDDRVRITATTTFPWRAICALRITAKDNTRWIGTGWLVSPRTVITAGHCVYMHEHGGWPKSIEVIPGMNDATRPYGSCTGTAFRSVAGWVNDKKREYDYGAIILPANCRPGDKTGVFGFAVKDDAYLLNSYLNLSGYPGDKGGDQQWFMARRAKSTAPRVIYYEIDTMGGQSGSPVWIKVGTARYAVGIHTNGLISGNSATRIVTPVFNNIQSWKTLGM